MLFCIYLNILERARQIIGIDEYGFKIQPEKEFSENKTKRIDVLRSNYNKYFEVIEFREALREAFQGFLDVYQPKNKQNRTIAGTIAEVLSELINIYRLQLGLNISDIDEYGFFPATVVFLKSKGISQHKMEKLVNG